jgi:hypothetical protein
MKQILFLALAIYLISKLSGFFFRAGAASQQNKNSQQRKREGNINVDSIPKKERKGEIKGGDYVDYEEVK